ncbi:MAG TPA: ABC transporter ATP-binding protein [Chloroflexota bacterium]
MMMHGGMGHMYRRDRGTQPVRVTKAMVRRILGYFRPYWVQIALALFTVAGASGLGLVPPMMIRNIIDHALPEKDLSLLVVLAAGMVGAPFLGGLLGVLQNYLNTRIAQRVMFDIRNELYRHVQSLSLRFFTKVKTGEVMSRLNNDVNGINQVIGQTVTQNVAQVFVLATSLFLIFSLDWRLALVSVLIVPAFLAPTRRVGNMRFDLQKETQIKQAELSAVMQETLNISGFVLMKAFARESYEAKRFTEKNGDLMAIQIRSQMLGRWFRMLMQVLGDFGPALIYLYGGYLVITGGMSVGTVVAFVILLNRLYQPISQLVNVQVELMGSMALFTRIFEYLDTEPDIRNLPGAKPLTNVQGRVAFRDVSFEYIPERAAIDAVSFEAEPGQLVALVGPSGAGKTTITYLLPRFYDVTQGAVEIDGQDVRNFTLESVYAHIGMVTQETYLYNASILENLRYARLDATQDEIEEACRLAQIHDVISKMPDGYETIVGERGYRLSGGEKQRLAIARVFLKSPSILILDEATSSMDSQTEAQIQDALRPLLAGRTTFAIAHRLSTVLAADKILVLDHGKLVETGTHQELLAKGGLYSELYEIQFKPQLTGAFGPQPDPEPVPEPAGERRSNWHGEPKSNGSGEQDSNGSGERGSNGSSRPAGAWNR